MKAVLIILGLAAVGAVAFIVIRNMQKPPTPVAAAQAPQGSLKDALAGLAIEGAVYGGKKLIEGGEYVAGKLAQGAAKVEGAVAAGAGAVVDAFVGDVKWTTLSDSALDVYIKRRNSGSGVTMSLNNQYADLAQKEKDRRAKIAADAYISAGGVGAKAITALAGKNTVLGSIGATVKAASAGVAPTPVPSAADIAAASAAASAANAGAAASKAQAISTPINTPPIAVKTPVTTTVNTTFNPMISSLAASLRKI